MPEFVTSLPAFLIWGLFGYLLGSVPFGLVVTRLMGLGDVRTIGSGNIGATNVLRTGNKAAAALTLLLDGGKGALVVILARVYGADDSVSRTRPITGAPSSAGAARSFRVPASHLTSAAKSAKGDKGGKGGLVF